MILRRLKLALYALGVLLILAGLGLAVLHTDWFAGILQRRLVAELRVQSGGEVMIESVQFRPLAVELAVRGLVIHGRRRGDEAPLFSANTLRIRARRRALLRGELKLRSLEWDVAEIHAYTRADGSSNLPALGEPAAPGGSFGAPLETSVGSVTLARTVVHWNEQRLSLEVQAENVGILLRRKDKDRLKGSLVSRNTRLRLERRTLPPLDLNARFELDHETAQAVPLNVTSGGLTATASVALRHDQPSALEARFQASGPFAAFAANLGFPEVRGGNLDAQGELKYQQGQYEARGRARLQNLVLVTPEFKPGRMDVSGEFVATGNRLTVPKVSFSALGGTAHGTGEISLDEPATASSIQLHLQGIYLQALLRSLGEDARLPGMVRFSSGLHGTTKSRWLKGVGGVRTEFDLKFVAPSQVAEGFYPLRGAARGSAAFDGGTRLQFQEASFHTEHSTLTARGSLGASTASLDFQLTTTDFEEWRPLAEYLAATSPLPVTLRAPLRFTGTLFGSLDRPQYSGDLAAGAFTFRKSEWDSLRATISGSSDHMSISSGALEHGNSSIRFSGSVTLEAGRVDPRGPAAVNVQLERSQLAGLREALGVPYRITGVATGHLELAGPLDRLTGSGQGSFEQGEFEGESFDSLSASLRVEEAVWHIEQIRLAKGPGRLSGYARIHPAERGFAAELYGQDFSLADVRHLDPMRKPDRPSLDARAGFELRAGGTSEKPHVLAVWNLGSLRVGETPIGFLGGRLDWQGELLRVEGHFLGEGGAVDFTGSAQTAGDWPAELSGRYENLRADPWMRMLMTPKFNPQLGLSGTLTLRGPLKRPEELELRARAESFEIVFPQPKPEERDIVTRPDLPEVSFPELAWKSEEPVDFRFQKDNLTISRFRLRGPSTDLVVEGSLRTGTLAALALEIQGSADATLLSLLDPALQASGKSDLRVRVGGTLADPLVFGTIQVQNVSLRYEDLPLRFTNLRGEIALEGERATIRGLRGMSGGGRVGLSGFISLGTASRFDARVELDEVRIPYPAPFTSVLDGNLRLLGSPDQGQLGGELIIRQLFASEDFSLLRVVEDAGRRAAGAAPTVHSPLAEKIRMNIQVRAAPAVRLETRDLRLVADLDLRVQGTLATPVEVGTIHFLSGETVFRGNRYKVVRGDLNMTNPFRTERQLDLEVQTRVQRYDLWVDLSGPLDRLRLSYRSDPPLPTTDILSLLAFGYARGEEGVGTTAAGQSVQTVGASALLSEALSSQVSGRIQRIFGVSRIRVDPNVGTLGPSGGARVTVEQQVTRDFTLTYVTTTASSSQQRIIQFEWILSESVAMVGVRDHNGILGLELRWRQRFK